MTILGQSAQVLRVFCHGNKNFVTSVTIIIIRFQEEVGRRRKTLRVFCHGNKKLCYMVTIIIIRFQEEVGRRRKTLCTDYDVIKKILLQL